MGTTQKCYMLFWTNPGNKTPWNKIIQSLTSYLKNHSNKTNKTHGEKARWELHKNATCCFEPVLEATPHGTTVIWSLTSHLKNHYNKTNKTCGTQLEIQGSTHLLKVPTNGPASVGQLAIIFLHLVCTDSGCSSEDLPETMSEWDGLRERERERESGKSMLSVQVDGNDIYTYEYIYTCEYVCIYIYINMYI